MSLTILPSFKFVPRITDGVGADLDEISLRRLRDVVAGKDTSFPRSRAMAMLLESDYPNKECDFQRVLENEQEAPEIRHAAALYLGKVNMPSALQILIQNAGMRDERVQAGVMKSLGRIGNESALDVISKVSKEAGGQAASQAQFAAALISHRLGLPGHDLPLPQERDYLELPRQAGRPLEIAIADTTEAEHCLRSLATQPFGIAFAEHPMYQVRCGRYVWMTLLNREYVDRRAVATAKGRKVLLGVVARRNETSGLYTASLVILTCPGEQANRVNVLVYHAQGDLALGGTAHVEAERAQFSIRAASRPGAFGVQLEGAFEAGRLEIKSALATLFAQEKKHLPVEEPRAGDAEGSGPSH